MNLENFTKEHMNVLLESEDVYLIKRVIDRLFENQMLEKFADCFTSNVMIKLYAVNGHEYFIRYIEEVAGYKARALARNDVWLLSGEEQSEALKQIPDDCKDQMVFDLLLKTSTSQSEPSIWNKIEAMLSQEGVCFDARALFEQIKISNDRGAYILSLFEKYPNSFDIEGSLGVLAEIHRLSPEKASIAKRIALDVFDRAVLRGCEPTYAMVVKGFDASWKFEAFRKTIPSNSSRSFYDQFSEMFDEYIPEVRMKELSTFATYLEDVVKSGQTINATPAVLATIYNCRKNNPQLGHFRNDDDLWKFVARVVKIAHKFYKEQNSYQYGQFYAYAIAASTYLSEEEMDRIMPEFFWVIENIEKMLPTNIEALLINQPSERNKKWIEMLIKAYNGCISVHYFSRVYQLVKYYNIDTSQWSKDFQEQAKLAEIENQKSIEDGRLLNEIRRMLE